MSVSVWHRESRFVQTFLSHMEIQVARAKISKTHENADVKILETAIKNKVKTNPGNDKGQKKGMLHGRKPGQAGREQDHR